MGPTTAASTDRGASEPPRGRNDSEGAVIPRPQPEPQQAGGTAGSRREGGERGEESRPQVCSVAGPRPLPDGFVEAVEGLEAKLGLPVVLLLQTGAHEFGELDESVIAGFRRSTKDLPNKKVALVIDSPGGQARAAYQLACLLRRKCGGFSAVVPRYAKSAATLLSLGAEEIILGDNGELGPLDAQLSDFEKEESFSALDDVQSLERLHVFGLKAIRETLLMLRMGIGKKVSTILPLTLDYVATMMRPLLEKIDIVHHTQTARILKVAEEYAKRLMRKNYGGAAEEIVRSLVTNYPEHGFSIDMEEAQVLQLKVRRMKDDENAAADDLLRFIDRFNAVGCLRTSP